MCASWFAGDPAEIGAGEGGGALGANDDGAIISRWIVAANE